MKQLILTQQQLADAYAVPVMSSSYQYLSDLAGHKEKLAGLVVGEYRFFDDGSIEYEEYKDFKEISVSNQSFAAWKIFTKASGQKPLLFSDYHFSLITLGVHEGISAVNLAEAAAELMAHHDKYIGLKMTRMDYFEDGIICSDKYLIFEQNKCSLKEAQELCQYVPQALAWVTEKGNEGIGSFLVDHANGDIAVPEEQSYFLPMRTFAVWGVSI